ncbi:MAG TPA: O-methyltransferase, partial [Alphaproteobacteria bacterium]|nr:O-methyltransferase [Alphaproteobacteria bacterium]
LEGCILRVLLQIHQSKKVVEVGTLAAYSTIWIARSLPLNGVVYSFEKDEMVANIARENIKNSDVADKIKIISGDAHANLKAIENEGAFDAIFIDAEKTGYIKYLEWADKNIRKGGLIIADNTLQAGDITKTEFDDKRKEKTINAIKNFNEAIANPLKYSSVILPTQEGLTVAIKLF